MSLLILTGSAGAFAAVRAAATLAGAASVSYAVFAGTRRARGHPSVDGLDRAMRRPTPARHPGSAHPPSARAGVVIRRRHRSSRARAEPSVRWELGADPDLAVASCGAFLDTLETLPRDAWLEVGDRVLAASGGPGDELTAAMHALEGVVAARRARVTAWLVRDAIWTSLQLAGAGSARRPDRRLRAARDAAERAALAHLVRPWLSAVHHRALVAPFASMAVIGPRDR